MVQQSRELFLLVAYGRPSLPGLRRWFPNLVRPVLRYFAEVRLLPGVHARRSALSLLGPVCDWLSFRRHGGLPVLVHVVSQRARGLRRGHGGNSRFRCRRCGFPLVCKGSTPRTGVYAAQYPAHRCLYLRFGLRLATPAARLEVRMVRYSFPAGLFHSLLHAGLARRSHTSPQAYAEGTTDSRFLIRTKL